MDTKLTQFYDDLKNNITPTGGSSNTVMNVGTSMNSPGSVAYIRKAQKECDRLKNDCCNHVILDIYCKILPLDSDYVSKNMGQMKSDVSNMLANKGMNATQYITSCHESTHSGLTDFILRATDSIAKTYFEEAEEELKDAQENEMDVPPPEAPTTDDEDVQNQLVDITGDIEYDNFVDQLRKKTIAKIVQDVSDIIEDEKKDDNMEFKTSSNDEVATESTVSIALDYINTTLMKENVDVSPELQEDMIGMAIREATLNQMDLVFKQPGSDFKNYKTRVLLGKGNIINESAARYFVESAKSF